MRKILFVSVLLFSLTISAQILTVQNPSFEGMPAETVTPAPWNNCNFGLTPDTQPGFFGVNAPPHNGNSYLGILDDIGYNWQEGTSQQLSSPMIAGQSYYFSIWLQQSASGQFTNDPVELQVFGGWSNCDQAELLASSGAVVYGNWTEYTFSFTPSANYTYILLLAHSLNSEGTERPYLLVDDMSPVIPCDILIDSILVKDTKCGLANGEISIYTENNYDFQWSTGASNNSITALDSGIYSVTISDPNGVCTWDTTFFIDSSNALTFDYEINNISCFGLSDGHISLVNGNGTLPYHYQWSNSGNLNEITNLPAGNYSVTVVDSNMCVYSNSFEVIQPEELTISLQNTNVSCYGYNDADISVNIQGGVEPYSILWSNGDTATTISNLYAGDYSVTVSDSNACSVSADVEIIQPSKLELHFDVNPILCYGYTDGSISVDIEGGTPGYSILWSTGDTSSNIYNLSGGMYYLTVSDENNCQVSDSVEMTTVGQALSISYVTVDNPCFGDNKGEIHINVTGGTPPYTYDWGHNIHDTSRFNLYAGDYSLTVSDANNCSTTAVIPVNQPNKLYISLPEDTKICKNISFDIQSSVTGGTPPYQYYWNTGNVADNISVSVSDSALYSVTVTDGNNCIAFDEIKINTYNLPELFSSADKDTVCPGNPVEISSRIIGGKTPLEYTINGDIADLHQIVYPYQTNYFEIKVKDACGNTANDSIYIYTYDIPALSISSDIVAGCPPLTVHFNENINSEYNFYNWSFGNSMNADYSNEQNPVYTFEQSGIYDVSLEVVTKEGCRIQQTINEMINVYNKPEAMFYASPEVVSIIEPVVSFENISTDNYNNYWYFGDGEMSSDENPVHNYQKIGEYDIMLVVENENGCVDSVYHHVSVKDEFTIYAPTAFSPDGDGINDGFKLVGNGIDTDNFILRIYNRWGELIWDTSDLFEEWKGTSKNGEQIVQSGTYKWLVICRDFNGVEYTKSGNVTLVR